MKIAYLILAHSDPLHFANLCETLNDEHSDIYVHVDAKQSESEFKNAVLGISVTFIKSRVSVSWAGISMIDALNLLIKCALKNKDQYSHFVFLTGSCYPIKSSEFIYRMLINTPKTQYIKYIDMRQSPEHYLKLVKQKWFKEPFYFGYRSKILGLIDKALRKLLNMMKIRNSWDDRTIPYFGSTWCALTVECCQYIIDFQDENPWYRKMNDYTFAPDEHFYHTIIGNSKFGAFATGLQPFEGRGLWRLANLHIIHPSLSKWYTLDDWDEIVGSDKLFVRKVRSKDGADLVTRIKSDLLLKKDKYNC